MKDGVIIVNAARGGVVDEKALLDGSEFGQGPGRRPGRLRQGAARGLDARRPSERHAPRPHIGAQAEEGQKRAGLEVVRILKEKLSSSG